MDDLALVPGISPQQARSIVNGGFHTLDELAAADMADIEAIPGIGPSAATLLEAARGELARRTTLPSTPAQPAPQGPA